MKRCQSHLVQLLLDEPEEENRSHHQQKGLWEHGGVVTDKHTDGQTWGLRTGAV